MRIIQVVKCPKCKANNQDNANFCKSCSFPIPKSADKRIEIVMIGKNIREYKIISEIVEGGMGTVYLAEHSILGQFAIKVLALQLLTNHQFRNRFITEAKALFVLKHDNIVHLHTFMEEGDNLFLVMEYIDGDSLDILIEKKKQIPEKDTIFIIKVSYSNFMVDLTT